MDDISRLLAAIDEGLTEDDISLAVKTVEDNYEEIARLRAGLDELEKELAQDRKMFSDVWDRLKEAEKERDRYKLALEKLRDCDWVISLPDRMDAVRKIAREALKKSNGENHG
ncbi:MAG TPA: hypothetical protein ENH40_06515 [Nitrospirae bacterium]|nr:hypothetical protein [Nitrospirota bacterium]